MKNSDPNKTLSNSAVAIRGSPPMIQRKMCDGSSPAKNHRATAKKYNPVANNYSTATKKYNPVANNYSTAAKKYNLVTKKYSTATKKYSPVSNNYRTVIIRYSYEIKHKTLIIS